MIPARHSAALCAALLLVPATLPAAGAPGAVQIERRTLRSAGGLAIEAEAGRLEVPENRAASGARTISIGFLRLKSPAPAPRAPILYLAGGPGQRAVSENPDALDFWAPFLEVADVVLIDQRGTNDSLLTWRWDGPPPLGFFVHADSAARHTSEMIARARAAFRARGVDLSGYTTVESATDLEELRAALGLERVSLLAFSYGTHLAAAYMRRFPERVESAVMLGTEGPDETYKLPWTMDVQFQKLALLAAADPRIAEQVPDLVALFDRVISKLEREPMRIPVAAPGGRDTLQVPIGPFGLRFMMRADIGDASDLIVFPRLLWSIEQGDPALLAWFLNKRAGIVLGVHGMSAAMDAASGGSPSRLATIDAQARTSRFADVVNIPPPALDALWGMPDLGAPFRAPLVSPVRTLFVSGELDFNTPPHQAESMRWGMPDATHLIVANAGHEQTFFQNGSAIPVLVDFLAGGDVRGRRITSPPLRFVPLEGDDPEARHPSVPR